MDPYLFVDQRSTGRWPPVYDKPVWTFAAIIERSGLMVSSVLKLASTMARRASVRAGNIEGS